MRLRRNDDALALTLLCFLLTVVFSDVLFFGRNLFPTI
jgi:hypothetical protein